ncbi:hypothetical protein FHS29_002257 [Saccharothrix tamanrassetensis]|uniref:Uncharacterized protein n=1 Tax=Saccharothrix tamanrassetensis TaxID=1051531 RepID=A0A841CJ44_9PSEU|nr:hypothetical protein [Saccharothrix tamanrassetensis]MBB5955676.1 hypothetical protein [Saccharothrix tamanrassetensis]
MTGRVRLRLSAAENALAAFTVGDRVRARLVWPGADAVVGGTADQVRVTPG